LSFRWAFRVTGVDDLVFLRDLDLRLIDVDLALLARIDDLAVEPDAFDAVAVGLLKVSGSTSRGGEPSLRDLGRGSPLRIAHTPSS
jgi:hypothetical protein